MPKAYSYQRFSTPRQQWGDSARRQSDMARSYAEKHGLELADEELADRGVSGYTGANMEDGAALAEFAAAVIKGHIPRGSVLLVEALDRISRQAAWRAQSQLTNLIVAGVTVVTLNDERVYNAETLDADPMALLFAIVGFMRGHDESAQKARRLRSMWSEKRRKAAAGEAPLTTVCPAWLVYDREAKRFTLREDRAEVVRRLFRETLAGVGRHALAQALNTEGVPTFGRSAFWRGTYIATVLANPAAIGTLVPETSEMVEGRRVRPKGEPIPGYYPVVVDEETFLRVQAMRVNAKAPQRGRHAGAPLRNVFAGLLKCSECGGAAVVVHKGTNKNRGQRKPVSYVVCERAKRGAGCVYRTARLDHLETALRYHHGHLTVDIPSGEGEAPLEAEIRWAMGTYEGLSVELDRLIDLGRTTQSLAVREKLREVEAQRAAKWEEVQALYERREMSRGPLLRRKLDDLMAALEAPEWDPTAINTLLRQVFSGVSVDRQAGYLTFHWAHGGEGHLMFVWPADA